MPGPSPLKIKLRLATVWTSATLLPLQTLAQPTIRGTVLAENGRPLPGAVVRIQLTDNLTQTDNTGQFELVQRGEPAVVTLSAWKHLYYDSTSRAQWNGQPVRITLQRYPEKDNPDYKWVSPSEAEGCGKCHGAAIVPQWERQLHAQAATNVLVRTMYSGTDIHGRPEDRLSYRHDFPGVPGNCAACHAPGAAANNPYGVFLDKVAGANALGVHCDFCHKIFDARIPMRGMPGVLSIELRRPPDTSRNLFFGPFDDTLQENDSYLPLQRRSRFCAPCHSHLSWGVPIYFSFPEWFESPYRTKGVECQDCHYTPDGKLSNIAPGHPSSVIRPPNQVPSHNLMGENRTAFIASAITLHLEGRVLSDRFHVTVRGVNSGAGHHFPTGQPMRNAFLVVHATNATGEILPLLKGDLLPVHAGDFAGQPGRFYAKVLEEIPTSYPDRPSRPVRIPAPQWVQTRIRSDTRIPALATEHSVYEFSKPVKGAVKVVARIVYRRAYSCFATLKGWDIPDVPVTSRVITLDPAASRTNSAVISAGEVP